MTIRNCPECGKIFEIVFNDLCPECAAQDEADLLLVKDYLLSHRSATIAEIVEETDITARKVFRLLRDKRLIAVCEKNKIQILRCERCQKPVLGERFCPECKEQLSEFLSKMIGRHEGAPAYGGESDARGKTGASQFTAHFRR
jgi:rRNA maturation endonuclease Nob1